MAPRVAASLLGRSLLLAGFLLSNLVATVCPKTAAKARGRSPTALELGEETDSPVEQRGFEPSVPLAEDSAGAPRGNAEASA